MDAKPANAYPMITIPEALARVLAEVALPGDDRMETVTLGEALGRVLAQAVTAPDSLPPFPASIKDGYAVVAADGAGEFPVVGEARAGAGEGLVVRPGTVSYITTGAPVPPGADAVVQVEDTEKLPPAEDGSTRVRIVKAARPGQDIRPVGSDIQAGSTVLAAGEVVGVAEVGILATVGATRVNVVRRPHVAVLSTGDEIVDPGTTQLGPGQIRDANRAMLLAAAAKAGAQVTDLGIARDTDGHLRGCLDKASSLGVDVLITSGGVSMGDRDLVKPLLERSGTIHFGRVLMKPGKPLTFATLDLPSAAGTSSPSPSASSPSPSRRMLVFGLPGNPVSSFACFHLVTLPALRKMSGWALPELRRVKVRVSQTLKLDPERPEYHRATLQWSSPPPGCGVEGGWDWWAMSTGNQISSRLLSARSANALLELPRASGTIAAGDWVSALLIDDLQAMPVPEAVPPTAGF